MEFTVLRDRHGYFTVYSEKNGGCDSFQVKFETEDEAHSFIIKLLIMNGDLPNTVDMNRL